MKYQDFTYFTKIPAYNDENDMATGLLAFDDRKCCRCGVCDCICPGRSIIRDATPGGWGNGLPRLLFTTKGITDCFACGCCVAACPEGAIRMERQFNPGHFFQRLTQTSHMTFPKLYGETDVPPSETGDAADSRKPKKINWCFKLRELATKLISMDMKRLRASRIKK